MTRRPTGNDRITIIASLTGRQTRTSIEVHQGNPWPSPDARAALGGDNG